MITNTVIPIFILVFLIICFIVFLWKRKKDREKQEHTPTKPKYSVPNKVNKEGFQVIASTSYAGSVPTGTSGSLSGSDARSHFKSQFDITNVINQIQYGEWENTLFDKYYDDYENNELYAIGTMAAKLKDITPSKPVLPDYGSMLGAFDSGTNKIPWDKDNESYIQSDIVWGSVSEQASRSIFMKVWLQQIALNIDNMIPCGEESVNYCYQAPLLNINTRDPKEATNLKIAELLIGGVGNTVQGGLIGNIGIKDLLSSKTYRSRYESISNFISGRSASKYLSPLGTRITQVGSQLRSVGDRVIARATKAFQERLSKAFSFRLSSTKAQKELVATAVTATITGASILANATVAVSAATVVGAPYALALTPVAIVLTAIAIAVDVFFGIFGNIVMAIEAIIKPIIDALFHTGGICPPNTKSIKELVDPVTLSFISTFLPLGDMLVMFDPYICWARDASVHLKLPHKMPAFMSDRTLSLIYHAEWQSGMSGIAPAPSLTTFMPDPLPPGYKYIADSDLADSTNANLITEFAMNHAKTMANITSLSNSGSWITSNSPNSGSTKFPPFLAVETCDSNTIPSLDGTQCLQKVENTDVQLPTLKPCSDWNSLYHDDGVNCWANKQDYTNKGCTGGQVLLTTSSTWDDSRGYYNIPEVTPLVCGSNPVGQDDTNVKVWFRDRIQCASGYTADKDTYLCYKNCDVNKYTREGALCKGITKTKTRNYRFATRSAYSQQAMNPETLLELKDVTIPYCNFASELMLNRMGQFYYNNSLNNPVQNEDGTIQIQIISSFLGVTASSELSCDVACVIEFISYDPITGNRYTSSTGCSYKDDPDSPWRDCTYCYRRFYFIRGDNDPQGVFTVTGCTFTDYTAPDAMVRSSDIGSNLVPSIPKVWEVERRVGTIVDNARLQEQWNNGNIMAQAGIGLTAAAIGIMLGVAGARLGGAAANRLATSAATRSAAAVARTGGQRGAQAATTSSSIVSSFRSTEGAVAQRIAAAEAAGIAAGLSAEAARQAAMNVSRSLTASITRVGLTGVGMIAGGVGGGILGEYTQRELTRISRTAILPEYIDNAVNTFITGPDMYNLSVFSVNNWFAVHQGPVYEMAPGHIPRLNFCETSIISESQCAHKYVIRDMVNKYHNEYPTKHIRQVTALEPRGRNGCYYKFVEVDYDPVTNIEQDIQNENEIILQHRIKDYATCTYESTVFNTNVNDISYPIRSYIDPSTYGTPTQRTIYPTRNTAYTSDLLARYVRVRPPLVAAGGTTPFINLSQLAVFDISGVNVSIKQTAYGTSVASGAASADIVVNGSNAPTSSLGALWQPATANPNTEYWEVDLGKNINIAEVVYFGGNITNADGTPITGRNQGIRIQFLYTNGINDTPIYEITLPTDESTQYIPVHSSSYTIPRYPVAGPIIIPRPVLRGMTLGIEKGCINKCEHKPVIDSLISQYNAISPKRQIVKILRGITATTDRCEYQAEILINDIDKTSDVYDNDSGSLITAGKPGKHTLVKEYLAINVLPTIKTVRGFPQVAGNVFARYVRIVPSFTPGTILAISNIRVLNAVADGTSGAKKAGYDVARNKNTTYYNEYYELAQMEPPPMQSPDSEVVDGGKEPEEYPHGFMARNNDYLTFFQIDLGDSKSSDFVTDSCMGRNYEIHTIEFYGMTSGQDVNIRNGIKGIQIELYKDQPNDQENCCNGKYPPVYVYTLPSDELEHKIVVSPPAACEFTINGDVTVLEKPHYLQENSPAFTTTDTSGGVFTFSGFLKNVQSTWNNILPMKSEEVVAPITENVKESDRIVKSMLETVSAAQTIAGTTKTCKDPEILKAMMTAYNIARGPRDTEELGVAKSTMLRILKSGQATPNTCDVMFESLYEIYDDYIEDITIKSDMIKDVKAVRFTFDTNGVPARDAAGTRDPKLIVDISANAIGLLTEHSTLNPVFSGPSYAVDCRNPGYLALMKAMLEQQGPSKSGGYTVTSSFKSVKQSFQSTPLSCEYVMLKDASLKSANTNFSFPMSNIETCVKAVFALGADGKTTSLSSVKEYYDEDVTFSSDYTKSYLKGVEVNLPSIFFYDPRKKVSKRVNATPQLI